VDLLLDTCTFLWIASADPSLSPTAIQLFKDPGNTVYLSAVSTWEIAVKHALKKLPLPGAPERFIPAQRKLLHIEPLPLDEESTLHLGRLPKLHKDPFDRMLVCQAIARGLPILTPDPDIQRYPVRTIW
jgi:PIN domain nuclease of toxin-antitoxin system